MRSVLSAIANAEAQPNQDDTPTSLRSAGGIAGAANGLAGAEVARRELDAGEIRAIVAAERDERLTSAEDMAARGALDTADGLRAEAAFIERYLT